MTYNKPEIHEVGKAEHVILGPTGVGSDTDAYFSASLAHEDFEE